MRGNKSQASQSFTWDKSRSGFWSPELIKLIKYDQPNLIEQTKLYYLLENPETAKILSLEKYNRILNRGSIAAPWKATTGLPESKSTLRYWIIRLDPNRH